MSLPKNVSARAAQEIGHPVSLREHGAVLLISCYELGHQPHGITLPRAFLERAGYAPATMDLAVEDFDLVKVQQAHFVAISVPMHTALRLGERVAQRIRAARPDCHICFHGHYALLHADSLQDGPADSVLGGELEQRLVDLVESLDRGEPVATGQATRASNSPNRRASRESLEFPVPSRAGLPTLSRYAHLIHADTHVVTGYAEATRGCLHMCRHCPIPAVYDGRLVVVPSATVMTDVRNQVQAGARHITFGDADFLNGPTHALRVASALHEEFPHVTFDFTAKVEHLVKHQAVVRQLAGFGALFVVSAVECLSNRVLGILDKGHTRDDVQAALAIARDSGIALRPSLMPFTPWSTRQDLVDILDWAEAEDLIDNIDPVQYTIRLLVPPGSLLLDHPEMQPHLGELDHELLSYRWRHPDPEMDTLQLVLATLVEDATARGEEHEATFALIREKVSEKLEIPRHATARKPPRRRRQRPPRLTESWFC